MVKVPPLEDNNVIKGDSEHDIRSHRNVLNSEGKREEPTEF